MKKIDKNAQDVYVYKIGNSMYINLTNQCTNDCEFCVRNFDEGVGGYNLWMRREPTADMIIALLGDDTSQYDEVVFCGYGESTLRLNDLKIIARHVKNTGGRVRLNTNGHANMIYRRNVAPELEGLVDVISISLNESTAEKYEQVCHPRFGAETYYSILNFAKECKAYIPEVILSVVDVINEEDIEACRRMADNLGVEFRVRESI